MKLHKLAFTLVLIGALNWGLSAFGWDLESWLTLSSGAYDVIYVLIGLSAVYEISTHAKNCKLCAKR